MNHEAMNHDASLAVGLLRRDRGLQLRDAYLLARRDSPRYAELDGRYLVASTSLAQSTRLRTH